MKPWFLAGTVAAIMVSAFGFFGAIGMAALSAWLLWLANGD